MSTQLQEQQTPAPYQPNKRTVGELLSMTSPPIIVPDWQRNYSWTLSHVETFWNDLLGFERRQGEKIVSEYFLGSVVIVETSSNQHLLLDGQQRLATSAILLSVIRDFVRPHRDNAATRIQARYLADFDDARNTMVYKLTLNSYDREYFRRKISEFRTGSYNEPAPEHASHNLISGARAFFEQAFQNTYDEYSPEAAFNWSLRIQDILMNHMTVIAVTSTNEDSAAEVFETLNDRGIGLSTPDLLRNLVIRRAPDAARKDIVDLWHEVIEFDTDTEIKSFLRHYWISHYGDIKTQGLYREIKSHLIGKNVESLGFSTSLKDAAGTYRDIKAARDDNAEVGKLLEDIADLGAGANILYPVILSITETVSSEEKTLLIKALLNLYVRHSVISQMENSRLENVIYRVARELRENGNSQQALNDFATFAPDDDAIREAFQRLSISHNGTRRYLLNKIEETKRGTEELTVSSSSKVHVEHIYPQTPKEGERLDNHDQIINRLGNLTLLSRRFNTAIKNGTFDEKKPYYQESEIVLTKELCGFEKWDRNAIEVRQIELAATIPDIWPVILPDG